MTTILVTAAGAPGAAALLRGLHENGEREGRIVGVDMSERAIGRRCRGGGERARLPGPPGLLQAGLLLRLARLPCARPDRRPRPPAALRTAWCGGDATRGGSRAAAGGRRRPARDGARYRRRAHD